MRAGMGGIAMFGVVCFRCDGRFDHSVGFATAADALAYVQAQAGDGCRYEVWNNGVRVS